MVRLTWTTQAKNDLTAIAEYIAQDSKKYARIQIHRIRSKAKQIIQLPESGRIVPELENESIRKLILGNYRIIYHLYSKDRVDILTVVHHSARRLKL